MVAQFVNIEVGDRSALGSGGLARHKRTATRDQHTTEGPRAGTPAVHLVDEVKGTRLALEAIEADKRRRAGKRGRPPGGVYNALFTGAPRYDGSNGTPLTPEQELAWAKACVEWVRERAPDAIIAAAILHRDEASPHLHLTLVPRYQPPPEKGEELEPARLDWRAVRAQLAGRAVRSKLKTAGLSKADIRKARANDKKEAQKDMVALLDSVHDQVMAPYGIERAITGEGKRRVAVDRRIAAELEAQGAEAAAERARERARKEAAAATEATERRRTAEQAQSDAEIKQRDRARKEAAAATEATERRRIAEQAQSDAEIKQRDREKKRFKTQKTRVGPNSIVRRKRETGCSGSRTPSRPLVRVDSGRTLDGARLSLRRKTPRPRRSSPRRTRRSGRFRLSWTSRNRKSPPRRRPSASATRP